MRDLINPRTIYAVVAAAAASGAANAADWPQWRGPQRSGVSSETGWQSRWTAGGPRRLWSEIVGQGFSSVAVQGNRLYTMGHSNGKDSVQCLDASTGRRIWSYAYNHPAGDYPGPRATPTLDGANVYTMSRDGTVLCLNAATGRLVWWKDLRRETRAQAPQWGFAGSPLIDGKNVIYNICQAGAALDKLTGRLAWKSSPSVSGYASPLSYSIGGQRGVAIFSAAGLYGVDPETGRQLWLQPWKTSYDVNSADPVLCGNDLFISSNYNRGGALVRLSGGQPSIVWENRNMRNHTNGCVYVGGYLFGNDENTLKCIDVRNGEERWRYRGGLGRGGLIAADGKLIVLTDRGELIVANAGPAAFTEISRARVGSGGWWTHPVLAGGRIYCRSQEGELVCLDVRA